MPTDSMALVSPMPSAPVTAIASTIGGNDSSASMKRLTISSIQPPRKPMISPIGTPSTMATPTASSEA